MFSKISFYYLYIRSVLLNNNPRKLIKRFFDKRRFYSSKVIFSFNLDKKADFEIYTIAYNNAKFIEYQALSLKKHLKDKFFYIVWDNSNNIAESKKIQNICKKYNIGYIKLPENPLKYSRSHIVSLNYICWNYILKRPCQYFWLLDHDIFLTESYSVLEKLEKQPIYGSLVDKSNWEFAGPAWSLSPRFAFFKKDTFNKWDFSLYKSLFPLYWLDSWGKMYKLNYKYLDKNKLKFPDDIYFHEKDDEGNVHRFQTLDKSWFHITNWASWFFGWEKAHHIARKKLELAFEKLDNFIK